MSVLLHTRDEPIHFKRERDLVDFATEHQERMFIKVHQMQPIDKNIDKLYNKNDAYFHKNELFVKSGRMKTFPLKKDKIKELWITLMNKPYDLIHLYLTSLRPENEVYKATIFAKTLTGKTITLDVEKNLQIKELKELIQSKEGISPDQQTLVYNARYMEDTQYLSAYDIIGEATIHIVLRLRGGMHHGTSFPRDRDHPLQILDLYGIPIIKIANLSGMKVSQIKTICDQAILQKKLIKESIHGELINKKKMVIWQQFFHLMDQWRTSDEGQEMFEQAEKSNHIDWIECVLPKQLQLARELGIPGSDEEIIEEMTRMAHRVPNPPISVRYNRAGACKTDTGEAVAEIKLVKQSDMSETTLQQYAEESEKKTVVVAAGSFT
jgi:ubiquitin-large subunit ribosomal protein L40e